MIDANQIKDRKGKIETLTKRLERFPIGRNIAGMGEVVSAFSVLTDRAHAPYLSSSGSTRGPRCVGHGRGARVKPEHDSMGEPGWLPPGGTGQILLGSV